MTESPWWHIHLRANDCGQKNKRGPGQGHMPEARVGVTQQIRWTETLEGERTAAEQAPDTPREASGGLTWVPCPSQRV